MARQALIGSGLTSTAYYTFKALYESPWYWILVAWWGFWLGVVETKKIRIYEADPNGWIRALIGDQFIRLWFVGGLSGLLMGVIINSIKFTKIDMLSLVSLVLLIVGYYFRTVRMPPPKPRKDLKSAFA